MDLTQIVVVLALGAGVGLLGGMLGIGGGSLLVPAMVFLLSIDQHTAQGVSLAVVVPTAVVGAATHYRHGNVLPRLALTLSVLAVVGAVAGAWLAGYLDGALLRRVFGVFLAVVAVRMALK